MSEENSKKSLPVTPILGVLLVIALGGLAFLGSMYWQTSQKVKQLEASGGGTVESEEAELQAVLDEVGQIVNLPQGVTPVLATVNNAESLKERQTFFKDAQNGDRLLLYANAEAPEDRKAFLYRPETKQLVNVAPINIGGQIQPQEDEFSIAIRNGTPTEGLATQMEGLMGRIFPNATVTEAVNASREDFEASVLVQLAGSDEMVQKVSELFNVDVVELPAGETAPADADMLLILGGGDREATEATEATGEADDSTETETEATAEPEPNPEQ